jgi:hypothetical protein
MEVESVAFQGPPGLHAIFPFIVLKRQQQAGLNIPAPFLSLANELIE